MYFDHGFGDDGRNDCWAGTERESCSCSKGVAKLTSGRRHVDGEDSRMLQHRDTDMRGFAYGA